MSDEGLARQRPFSVTSIGVDLCMQPRRTCETWVRPPRQYEWMDHLPAIEFTVKYR
jgi:hypothetical protein